MFGIPIGRPWLVMQSHAAAAFDGGEVPFVGTLFIKLPGGSAKHAYRHVHAPRVRAPYRLYCSPPEHCRGIATSRRAAGVGLTEVVPFNYDDVAQSLAIELNVSVDTLHRAAQRSVAPQHCPSREIIVLWLAKLLIMKLTIAAHPERQRFAWVDAGFNVYRVRNMDPPPAPWTSFWPAPHSVAMARHPGACHNELRNTNYSSCPVATYLYGDRLAWMRLLPLYFAHVRRLVLVESAKIFRADAGPPPTGCANRA